MCNVQNWSRVWHRHPFITKSPIAFGTSSWACLKSRGYRWVRFVQNLHYWEKGFEGRQVMKLVVYNQQSGMLEHLEWDKWKWFLGTNLVNVKDTNITLGATEIQIWDSLIRWDLVIYFNIDSLVLLSFCNSEILFVFVLINSMTFQKITWFFWDHYFQCYLFCMIHAVSDIGCLVEKASVNAAASIMV